MWDGIALGCVGKCVWGCGCHVPVIDHHPPMRENIIFELSQLPWQRLVHGLCYLLDQAVDFPLLGDNKKKTETSWEWYNPRIIHVVSLSLFLLCGDIDIKGICVYNSMIY